MSKELTEAKELTHQVMEKISQHELLEEARRRFPIGTKYTIPESWDAAIHVREIKSQTFNYVQEWIKGVDAIGDDYFIIYRSDKGWAEIIPEQKDEIEICPTCSFTAAGSTVCSDPFHDKYRKSLHDQIREGGWKKVMKMAGHDYKIYAESLWDQDIEPLDKLKAYNRLLALSKVLNEGKEKKTMWNVSRFRDGEAVPEVNEIDIEGTPLGFYQQVDFDFALEFAEKEWKIFYNQEA